MNCSRFNINFNSGTDIAFHFDARFNPTPVLYFFILLVMLIYLYINFQEIVRNTFRKGSWELEEKNAPNFPFELGGTFDLIFLCDHESYKVRF